jgi:hypothetical protein
LLILSFQMPLYGQQFKAEGTIVYSTESQGASYQETKHFIVARDGVQWKIRTIPINRGAPQESAILFEEAGYDGTNIFCLTQNDTNKAYLYGSPNLTKQKNFAPALGRVQKADCLPFLEMNLIFPLWLAYSSSHYLTNLTDNKVVAPLFVQDDFFTGTIPKAFNLPAKWKLNPSFFISEIQWFSEGEYMASDHDGSQKLEKYLPPFDKGFLQASYETTEWTNFDNMELPKSFLLKVFAPDYRTEGKTNVNLIYTISADVQTVESLGSFSCMPNLSTKTIITDSRLFLGDLPISYESTSNWDTVDEMKAKLHNIELGLNPSDKMHYSKRPIILLLMASITAIFIAVFKMTKLMNKNK